MTTTLPDTFWDKVDQTGTCWLWTGGLTRDGYGTFNSPRPWRTNLVHRLSLLDAHGGIPHGYQVDHLCRVRACVNPDHLEAVTQQENIRRQWAARKQAAA